MKPEAMPWLILGGSSALARAFARAVAAEGAPVLLAGRDHADLERQAADLRHRFEVPAEALAFDALAVSTHAAFAHALEARLPGPFAVFLAFGQLTPQPELEAEPERAATMIMANLGGAAVILLELARLLAARGGGRLVVVGSVAGDRGRRSNHVYGAAKAGLETLVAGLRARLFPVGVPVLLVKPGFLDTAMTFGMKGLFLVAAPEDAARAILRAVRRGRLVAYVPWFWRWIMLIFKLLPERIMQRLPL